MTALLRNLAKLPLHFYFESPARFASALQRLGCGAAAEEVLFRMHCAHPYDYGLAEHLADMAYERRQHELAVGTIARGQFIMRILDRSFPSKPVTSAYLENLRALLAQRRSRAKPGKVVLGLGAGRCGSTTLAGILQTSPGAVSTHEIAPFINWEPLPRQVQFHLNRFRLLQKVFPMVADCAHWWINAVDGIFDAVPGSVAIGLIRDLDDCVRSWMAVSPEDVNHWIAPYSGIWPADKWDPLYPHYDLPRDARRNRRRAKESLVRRYVSEYNDALAALAARHPDRMLLLRTETLDLTMTRHEIEQFVGLPIGLEKVHLNRGIDLELDGEVFPALIPQDECARLQ